MQFMASHDALFFDLDMLLQLTPTWVTLQFHKYLLFLEQYLFYKIAIVLFLMHLLLVQNPLTI